MHTTRFTHTVGIMLGLCAFAIIGLMVGPVQAGSLEPPASAVDAEGNPVPTTQTQPSWETLPASERFVLVMGGAAVLDKETGLVWEQSPSLDERDWEDAANKCIRDFSVGGRGGWRLPSVHELASLFDPVNTEDDNLPPGHPFSDLQEGTQAIYWTATTDATNPERAYSIRTSDVGQIENRQGFFVGKISKANRQFVWCVRGGHNHGSVY